MNHTVTKLNNGLQVITIDTKSFPSVTTLLLVGAGSRYETVKNNGIAHFFEHMAFKGSKKYPSAHALSSRIDGLGGIFNAFTGKDHTGYWIKAPTRHFNTSIDILADMIQNPLIKKEEIEKEKGVIVEEINMYEDMPARKVIELWDKVLFDGHPLGMPIIGSRKGILLFSRDTFTSYINALYKPHNVIVVVAGGLSKKNGGGYDYVSIIKEKFQSWKDSQIIRYEKFLHTQKKPQILVETKETEQAHFCVGFRAYSYRDERKYALSVLSAILGKGMSSRLFTQVREQRGLCYYIQSYVDSFHETGSFLTHAGVRADVKQINRAITVILHEHSKIVSSGIEEEEFKKAKELLKGQLILSLEDTFSVAAFFGKRKLHLDKIETPAQIISKIDQVTLEDVVNVAKDTFVKNKLNFALIGPIVEKDITAIHKWK